MSLRCWSRAFTALFLVAHVSCVVGDTMVSPEEVKRYAEPMKVVLGVLGIDVSTEKMIECLGADHGESDVVRMTECLREQGVFPALALPTDSEITSATRPMLVQTSDWRWHAFQSSQDGFLIPAVSSGGTQVKVSLEGLKITWTGFAIMLSRLPAGEAMPEPARMRLESLEKYFGEVPRGKKVQAAFPFKNSGGMPLRFQNASPEKKAIQIRAVPDQIEYAPGESGELIVTYDTRYGYEPASIAADLLTTDPRLSNVTLNLRGSVVDPVFTVPRSIEFPSMVRGATAARRIQLVPVDGSAFGVAKVSSSDPSVTVSVCVPDDVQLGLNIVPLRVLVDGSKMNEGGFEVTCRIQLSPQEMGSISFPVTGTVVASDSNR